MDGSEDDLMWEEPAAAEESDNESASEEEEPSDAEDAAEWMWGKKDCSQCFWMLMLLYFADCSDTVKKMCAVYCTS